MSNMQRIINYVAKRDRTSVSDLKRDLGLTHPTASSHQATLKKEGKLVVLAGEYKINERGRKEEVFVTPENAGKKLPKRGFF